MLRLGIVDCDSSHVYQFSRRLNHVDIEEDQWVNGAKVVSAFVGESRVTGPDRILEYVNAMRETGVELVKRPEDMLGSIDGVLIESNEGGVHRAQAEPFIRAGLPVFVDKPLATSTRDARELVELAHRFNVPLLSASSLRFASGVEAIRDDESIGRILGVDVYAPARLHEANPGLFHYGVHGVEMLYSILGPGCKEVSRIVEDETEVTVGRWEGGRIGTLRGMRAGDMGYGLTVHGEKKSLSVPIDTTYIYRNLLRVVVSVLSGNPSPVSGEELVEVVAFQVTALESAASHGKPAALEL